ncbi:unnamed protein product [Vitrella brassicaformis CCMP3155]|uniref:Secreted protein n=1 Tax=Vitrella brassicaformis (strain CCMP3155) TaxID=1169540 RepID=A0A0G4EFZ5_VITBC|nr:unnamed protein product [Vitrella brassicaformis CCMP3155]|eukprot:CEL94370.1 unnamed protein product [Vitrella brassicaformis CCMP3155]
MRFSSSLCLVYLATAEGVGSGETRTCQLAVGGGGQLPFGEGNLDLRVEIAVTKSRDCERKMAPSYDEQLPICLMCGVLPCCVRGRTSVCGTATR